MSKPKPTPAKELKRIEIKSNGLDEVNVTYENMSRIECIGLLTVVLKTLTDKAMDTKPAARDKGDDML